MSILSEGNTFGINKPKGSHLDHCKSCGGGWKYTFYVDQTNQEVRSVLKSRGYKDYDSVCPKCIKSIERLGESSTAGLSEYEEPRSQRSPYKFREWAYEDVSGEMMMLFDEMNVPGPDRDKYYDYMDSAEGIAFLKELFDEWTDEETAAKQFIQFCKDQFNQVKEDFSMGIGGPTGLNQGIPHGGPGKGVLPKPLYNPKAKAVPPKEEDDKDTEENLKKLRAAKKLLRNEGFALVREAVGPLMDPIDEFENYLHDEGGFDWDEVDCLIDNNREMIQSKLDSGVSYERIVADLDSNCLRHI